MLCVVTSLKTRLLIDLSGHRFKRGTHLVLLPAREGLPVAVAEHRHVLAAELLATAGNSTPLVAASLVRPC